MRPNAETQSHRRRAADLRGGEKLVVDGVVTHERLIEMIKRRNPIIARRDDRAERAPRS